VAILAVPFLKEKLSKLQIASLGILLFGNYIFNGFGSFKWGIAETMVLAATIMWAAENIIAKKVLGEIEPLVLAWARMFFGSIVLLTYLMINGQVSALFNFKPSALGWVILSALLLLGYVMTWYSALKKEAAITVVSILVLASPITSFLEAAFGSGSLSATKIWGTLILLVGIILFVIFKREISLKEISRIIFKVNGI